MNPSDPIILIAYTPHPDLSVERQVLNAIQVDLHHVPELDSPEAVDLLANASALMVTIEEVSADLLAKMRKCRIVSRVGTGLDAIDVKAATGHGIWVTYVPDYAIDEVSTHTIALLLSLARRIPALIRNSRSGVWDANSMRPFPRFKSQILGILGFGRIGQDTAAKARGIGLRVIAYDPHVAEGAMEALGVKSVDYETLLRSSDYISLHMPLDDTTASVINAETFAMMKPTSFLINTARGALIDEHALLMAVRNDQIAGAALDVLAEEPPPADHPLLTEDRIIVTPHVGWYSEDADRDVRAKGAEEVARVLQGDRPRSPVNSLNVDGHEEPEYS